MLRPSACCRGDFKIVYPAPGETGPADYDESYRLARYVDFDHWKDTRRPARMIGTGPLSAGAGASGSTRRGYQTDDGDGLGAVYLRGNMAPDRPYHMPARGMEDEEFEPMEDTDTAEPVRITPTYRCRPCFVFEQQMKCKSDFHALSLVAAFVSESGRYRVRPPAARR